MRIGVCIKQVPAPGSPWALDGATFRLDRSGGAVLDPADAVGVEAGLRCRADFGGELVAIAMGPQGVAEALRSALSLGADRAIQVTDERLQGADALATARVLAAVAGRESCDLVLAGAESGDGSTGIVPAAIAELLGMPALTQVVSLRGDGDRLTVTRRLEGTDETVEAELPAVVSVVSTFAQPRYPTLPSILAAARAPLEALRLGDLGLADVLAHSGTQEVVAAVPAPVRDAAEIHYDGGDSGRLIADFLAARNLV